MDTANVILTIMLINVSFDMDLNPILINACLKYLIYPRINSLDLMIASIVLKTIGSIQYVAFLSLVSNPTKKLKS